MPVFHNFNAYVDRIQNRRLLNMHTIAKFGKNYKSFSFINFDMIEPQNFKDSMAVTDKTCHNTSINKRYQNLHSDRN